jgi:hypothetical protein
VKYWIFILILPLFLSLPIDIESEFKKPHSIKKSALTQNEIQLIKGIGPQLSSDIVNTNKKLANIKGIGEKRLDYLKKYIIEN